MIGLVWDGLEVGVQVGRATSLNRQPAPQYQPTKIALPACQPIANTLSSTRNACTKQEVKHLKQMSLWSCTFNVVVSSLAWAEFTILVRIKLVFGASQDQRHTPHHRSLTLSSAIHPSAEA